MTILIIIAILILTGIWYVRHDVKKYRGKARIKARVNPETGEKTTRYDDIVL